MPKTTQSSLLKTLLIAGLFSPTRGNDPGTPTTQPGNIELTTQHLRMELSAEGRLVGFVDRRNNQNYAVQPGQPIASLRRAGQTQPVTKTERTGDQLLLRFGNEESAPAASVRIISHPSYLVLELQDVRGKGIEEFQFLSAQLTLKGQLDDLFAACGLALNLKTNVPELPGPCATLHASCYQRFGMPGAQVAIIGCPVGQLRSIMQEVVKDAPDLPHSPLGGPWALDAPINRGSYMFNFGDVSEETVDQWIETIRRLGFDQLDFHGGSSFRFGDLQLNPKTYPRGVASLKAVIDKLHAAGISAGLHTYSWFMAKNSTYVTPRPDPRLGKDATFTLAADLPVDAKAVPVTESTKQMSTTTGFFVSNSVTLQIDDELITYGAVTKEAPYAFSNCQRGAYGTGVAAHARGAKVYHLKELFGLFAPDEQSNLLEELAHRTADLFNEAGFDMIYLDALDGEALIGGPDAAWHYGSKFPFEIARHLKKPALMEMSTFHHHLWYLRSRYIAWDHPNRGYKPFIDIHCEANDAARRMFLPGHLGWWRVQASVQSQIEPTFGDDIEYLCCKCLGRGEGFSMIGIDPTSFAKTPAFPRLAEIMRRYEQLRRSGKVPESILARLREPGHEFTLEDGNEQAPRLRPVFSRRHKVDGMEGGDAWTFTNPFARQPARLRIHMLLAAGGESASAVTLSDMRDPAEFKERAANKDVSIELKTAEAGPQPGTAAVNYRSENHGAKRPGAWSSVTKTFSAPMDLSARPGLSVWVRGDGGGELLNVQLRCPSHLPAGIGEHYIPIDFNGWRQVKLVEAEGDRCAEYQWPYSGNAYGLYREEIDYHQVASVGLWYNNVPPGSAAACQIGPIQAIPVQPSELRDPSIECNGQRVTFHTTMSSGQYLEVDRAGACHLYATAGEELPAPKIDGSPLMLEPGGNRLHFACTSTGSLQSRVQVMLTSIGEPLNE